MKWYKGKMVKWCNGRMAKLWIGEIMKRWMSKRWNGEINIWCTFIHLWNKEKYSLYQQFFIRQGTKYHDNTCYFIWISCEHCHVLLVLFLLLSLRDRPPPCLCSWIFYEQYFFSFSFVPFYLFHPWILCPLFMSVFCHNGLFLRT